MKTGFNVKYFNGSVADTFEFVLTSLVADKTTKDSIEPDHEWFEIVVKTYSTLYHEPLWIRIFFFENVDNKGYRHSQVEFTKVKG